VSFRGAGQFYDFDECSDNISSTVGFSVKGDEITNVLIV